MISRNSYLAHGVAPVDSLHGFEPHAVPDEIEPNTIASVSKNMSGVKRLSNPREKSFLRRTPSLRLKAQIEQIAESLAREVAPSVSAADMPCYLPRASRSTLYVRILSFRANLSRISRMALAHELTPPLIYWETVVRDCSPIVESTVMEHARTGQNISEENLDTLNQALSLLESQLGDTPPPLGRPEICSSLATILLIAGAALTAEDTETLMSHFVVQSRVGNRQMRQFEKIAGTLPDEAARACDMIKTESLVAQTLTLADRLSQGTRQEFVQQGRVHLRNAARVLRAELRDGANIDVFRRPVLAASAEDLASKTTLDQAGVEKHDQFNREICANFPAGGGELQMNALAFQIAARRITERYQSIETLLSRASHKHAK